jgi:hypothetical protein
MDMSAKGSIIVPWVKAIKADKSGVYDKYLSNKDREIISERLLPNVWYPFETYRSCVNAVFEVIAKKDLETITEWTRIFSQQVMTGLYGGVLEGVTPLNYIKRCGRIFRNFFIFGKIEGAIEGENQALVKVFFESDIQFIPFNYIIKGWIEGNLALCGAKNVKGEIITKSWEGSPYTSMRFTWTS